MAGAVSQAGFCLAYAWTAKRARWPASLVAGCAAFAASTALLQRAPFTLPAFVVVAFGGLALALYCMPPATTTADARAALPWWDLPLRMAVATMFVIALTAVASRLGPHLTGLLAPFPLYAAILTGFAHAMQGARAASAVLRGLLLGLFSFAAFFLVLAVALERLGMALAFSTALLIALAVQGGSLWALTRTARPMTAGPPLTR